MKIENYLEKSRVEALKENMTTLLRRLNQFIDHQEYKNLEFVRLQGDVQQMNATPNPSVDLLFKQDHDFSADNLAALNSERFIIEDDNHETYDIEKLKRRRDNIQYALEMMNNSEAVYELGDVAAILNTVIRLVYPSISYQHIVSYLETPAAVVAAQENIEEGSKHAEGEFVLLDEANASNDADVENPMLSLIDETIDEMTHLKDAIEKVLRHEAKNSHWKKELEKTNVWLATLHHAREEIIQKPDHKAYTLLENLRLMALYEKANDHITAVNKMGDEYYGSKVKMAMRYIRKTAHHHTEVAATVSTAKSMGSSNDDATPVLKSEQHVQLAAEHDVPLVTSTADYDVPLGTSKEVWIPVVHAADAGLKAAVHAKVVENENTLSTEETTSIIKCKNYLNAKLAVYEANTKTQIAAKAEKLARYEKMAALSPIKIKSVEDEIARLENLKLTYEGHLDKIAHARTTMNAYANKVINKTARKTPSAFIETFSGMVDQCEMKPYQSKVSTAAPVTFFKAKASQAKAAFKIITTPPTEETIGERLKRELKEAISFIKPK